MPVRWRLRRNLAALEQELDRAFPEMLKAAVNRGCHFALLPDPFDCGSDQRYGAETFGPRSDLLSGTATQTSTIEALERIEEVLKELWAECAFPLRRFPIEGFRFGIALAHPVEAGDCGLS